MQRASHRYRSAQYPMVCLMLVICLALVGCGQADPSLASEQALLADTATTSPSPAPVTATPTLSPLDATKLADDARWEEELATAAARPTPTAEEPLPADEPLEPLSTGISTDCDSLYDRAIDEVNCWQDTLDGQFIFVAAGAEPADPSQGKLVLYTATPDGGSSSPMEEYQTPGSAGAVSITSVTVPRLTVTASDGTAFIFNLQTRSWEAAGPVPTPTPISSACEIYPIALHSSVLSGVASGQDIPDIFNGAGPGNFGWLSWNDDQSANALAQSLTSPGDSASYANPAESTDHTLSGGDQVRARPGVTNSTSVRQALDTLIGRTITVPVWSQAVGSGKNMQYTIVGFARVQITSYQLASQNRISVRYQGTASCSS